MSDARVAFRSKLGGVSNLSKRTRYADGCLAHQRKDERPLSRPVRRKRHGTTVVHIQLASTCIERIEALGPSVREGKRCYKHARQLRCTARPKNEVVLCQRRQLQLLPVEAGDLDFVLIKERGAVAQGLEVTPLGWAMSGASTGVLVATTATGEIWL